MQLQEPGIGLGLGLHSFWKAIAGAFDTWLVTFSRTDCSGMKLWFSYRPWTVFVLRSTPAGIKPCSCTLEKAYQVRVVGVLPICSQRYKYGTTACVSLAHVLLCLVLFIQEPYGPYIYECCMLFFGLVQRWGTFHAI